MTSPPPPPGSNRKARRGPPAPKHLDSPERRLWDAILRENLLDNEAALSTRRWTAKARSTAIGSTSRNRTRLLPLSVTPALRSLPA